MAFFWYVGDNGKRYILVVPGVERDSTALLVRIASGKDCSSCVSLHDLCAIHIVELSAYYNSYYNVHT